MYSYLNIVFFDKNLEKKKNICLDNGNRGLLWLRHKLVYECVGQQRTL